MKLNRLTIVIVIPIVIGLGLLSRQPFIPKIIYPYLGDALYAAMMYFVVRFFLIKSSAIRIAIISCTLCFLIETSQIYSAPWIDTFRETRIGSLILGHGFLWSDLLAYTIGTLLALSIEMYLLKLKQKV